MAVRSEVFSSRWSLILAALGMAVGTGNIWRFPRVAAQNGGGAFIIAWILSLFIWSIPLLMVEFAMGKKTRRGPIGAFVALLGPGYAWMGGFVGLCTLAILSYYSVVTGWCLRYFLLAARGALSSHAEASWKAFTGGSSWSPVLFHAAALGIGGWIIHRGVVRGIEKANKILIPALFLLLVVAALRAVTLEGASRGLEFLFHPDLGHLTNYRIWLAALSQSAWSTGAGWGLVLTYACYMREGEDITLNAVLAGLGNNSASLLAGLAIVPTVFSLLPQGEALKVMGAGNNGLAFIWIPRLFGRMMGGQFFAAIFFLALTVAAISSLMAMLELGVRLLMDMGWTRDRALAVVLGVSFTLGLPSALSMRVFENQDWVWGVGLLLSGLFIAFAALRFGVDRFRRECINGPGADFKVGPWWNLLLRFLIPVEFAAMIVWWFGQAMGDDQAGWWNPFHATSVGTCLFQWGLLVAVLAVFNGLLARWSRA